MDAQQLKDVFGNKVRFWTGTMSVEDAAVKQLQNIAELPILGGPLAIMPDIHMGKGACVGSVIPTLSAVIPSAVGVDIGCGMIAVRTGLKAADLLLSHFLRPTESVTLTWDNHRWIRFRSALARLEELLQQFQLGLSEPEPGELSYMQLLDRGPDEPPHSYHVTQHQHEFIQQWMTQLLAAAHASAAPESSRPSHRQPRPTPLLRVSPRIVPEATADRPDVSPIDPPGGAKA